MSQSLHPEGNTASFWGEKAASAMASPHNGDAVPVNTLHDMLSTTLSNEEIGNQSVPAALYLELLREIAFMRGARGERSVNLPAAHIGAIAALNEVVTTTGIPEPESRVLLAFPAVDIDTAA